MTFLGTGIVAKLREIAAKLRYSTYTQSEKYWTDHNVTAHHRFKNAKDSLDYLAWRNRQYYGYAELMPTTGANGLTVLDFGCGPGHDLVGFGAYSNPSRLIAVDVSTTSLAEANSRLKLHDIPIDFHQVDVQKKSLPIPEGSVDLIHSSGVLHHMLDPGKALSEFRRVLKPGGVARIMVYNRQSIWYHLYVPYVLQIEQNRFSKLPRDVAFQKSTDGPGCPVSRAYQKEAFQEEVESYGFTLTSYGAAVSAMEMLYLEKRHTALMDRKLSPESQEFLADLTFNDRGWPINQGYVAGIDGCYSFQAV